MAVIGPASRRHCRSDAVFLDNERMGFDAGMVICFSLAFGACLNAIVVRWKRDSSAQVHALSSQVKMADGFRVRWTKPMLLQLFSLMSSGRLSATIRVLLSIQLNSIVTAEPIRLDALQV